MIKTIDTGPTANHVNFARTTNGTFAYVTIGGLNEVKVFRTDDFSQVATIHVGSLPHGVWPSGDGSRIYVGLENADAIAAIDTASNTVVANISVGQAPQALVYVPNASPDPQNQRNLQPLGVGSQVSHVELAEQDSKDSRAPTSVSLFDQGLIQVLQASVTGLEPKQKYVLALADQADGRGSLQPLAAFMTNPAGSAIVNAVGPIRPLTSRGDAIWWSLPATRQNSGRRYKCKFDSGRVRSQQKLIASHFNAEFLQRSRHETSLESRQQRGGTVCRDFHRN